LKKDIFAVCDLEASYATKLMEAIQEKQGAAFEIRAFTSANSLCEFAAGKEISLLLISARAMCQDIRDLKVGKMMILSEGEQSEELVEYPCVYKYQASDDLVAEVMGYYAAQRQEMPQALLKKNMRCVAVYSPVKRALKTSFALTLGQIEARERRVLYINLESYSGLSWLMEKEYTSDLADLMYFVKRGYGSLAYKLQGVVQSLDNLDYIPPALSPMDIRSVTCEEWLTLFGEIEAYSTYDMVILDMDETVDGFLEILRHCHTIYMPVREDGLARAKLEQYDRLLEMTGYEDLREKTLRLKLPYHSSFGTGQGYARQLPWGELGDFVRKLIREEQEHG
jgi:hypothetical protein